MNSREVDVSGPFMMLMQLCMAHDKTPLPQRVESGACLHVPINDIWTAWINPHPVNATFQREGVTVATVPPVSAWIEYNGWPWGVVGPFGGDHGDHPDPDGATLEHFARACSEAMDAGVAP
jgi:hypothetical protein